MRSVLRTALCLGWLIAFLLAAWQPSSAIAQDKDVQLWVYTIAQGDLDEDTRLTVDFTARWREQARGDEQQTLRFNIDRDAGDGFRIGGGFGVFEAGGNTELRPHQQFTWRSGRVSTRTRLEQRFFDGADRLELRFRHRVRYTQPVSSRVSASIDGEYFNLLQTRDRDPGAARDQWRGRLIVSYRLSDDFTIGAAYLLIHTPQPGRADQVNHVPQALVTRRF